MFFSDLARSILCLLLITIANLSNFNIFGFDYSPLFLTVVLLSTAFKRNYALIGILSYLIVGIAGLPIFAFGGGFSYILQSSLAELLSLTVISILSYIIYNSFKLKVKYITLIALPFGLLCSTILRIILHNFNWYHFIDMLKYQLIYDLLLGTIVISFIKYIQLRNLSLDDIHQGI